MTADSTIVLTFTRMMETIEKAFDLLDLERVVQNHPRIMIKPNLVNASPHPVTTAPGFTKKVILALQKRHPKGEIIIAEGTGDATLDTHSVFHQLGYDRIAQELEIPLVDINKEEPILLENPDCTVFPKFYLPRIATSHFIVSLPVLKAHSLAGFTGTIKNMMGFAPPKYYGGRFGTWKKAVFHGKMQESLLDLQQYILPHFTVMDASIGLPDFHLGGRHCSPPLNRILAGFDAHDLDRTASALLNLDWKTIPYLS